MGGWGRPLIGCDRCDRPHIKRVVTAADPCDRTPYIVSYTLSTMIRKRNLAEAEAIAHSTNAVFGVVYEIYKNPSETSIAIDMSKTTVYRRAK